METSYPERDRKTNINSLLTSPFSLEGTRATGIGRILKHFLASDKAVREIPC